MHPTLSRCGAASDLASNLMSNLGNLANAALVLEPLSGATAILFFLN